MSTEAILTELAQYDNRKLLLWELAADGRDFCGVEFVANEYNIENAPIEDRVKMFVEDMTDSVIDIDGHDTLSIRDEYDNDTGWKHLEERYGDIADRYL